MMGLSTSGNISLGCALVAGRNRVPRPAAGKTALRTLMVMTDFLYCVDRRQCCGLNQRTAAAKAASGIGTQRSAEALPHPNPIFSTDRLVILHAVKPQLVGVTPTHRAAGTPALQRRCYGERGHYKVG